MSNLVKAQPSVLEKLAMEEIDLLKNEICKGATNIELVHFLKVCSSLNLNPFTKQIYSLPFSGGRVVVIGIDGLSTIAHRTNEYVGCGPATFEFRNPNDKEPLSAEVTVYRMRNGIKGEFTAKVFMDEYKPKFKSTMWDKFPKRMLEKCAHALALKKGFNEEMTGLYTTEEMDQAKNDIDSQGKIIDLETLAQKEKPFNEKEFGNLLISYCEIKLQEGVTNPIHNILDHLNAKIQDDKENKQFILDLDEKAKKDLMVWLENQLR
tara:strand:- start:4445 stop:5236 length:792 start_codon:yes stop_codon:yes gene_type:complete